MYFNKIRSGNPKGKSAAGDCDNDDDGDNLKENQVTIVDKDVVIIGGGCAGVECASKLISNGFKNIVVLEAQDYLGGRIKTHYDIIDENSPIEIGANWIHGCWDNPLMEMINENPTFFQHKKKNLFLISADAALFVNEHGEEINYDLAHDLYDVYTEWNEDAKDIWEKEMPCRFASYTEFMWHKLDEHMNAANDPEHTREVKRALMRQMLKQETAESGCHVMDLCNLKEYGSYSRMTGPDYEFPGGFSKVIEHSTKNVPKSCIKLNHPVSRIRLLDKQRRFPGGNILTKSEKSSTDDHVLLIECENGNFYRAKHVVVTVSVNYLQKHYASLFDAALLTEKKVEAIRTVQMSTVDKVFLFYDDLDSFFPADKIAVKPVFSEERSGGITKDNWIYKVYTFDKFYDNVLLVWLTGEEANYAETLEESEIVDALTGLLRKLLKNDSVPKPKQMLMTDWNSNPYMLGSYSYIDLKGTVEHIENLAKPLYVNKVPRVCFAGEATHPRFYSTVHGAYLSGQREAQRILDFSSATSAETTNVAVATDKQSIS